MKIAIYWGSVVLLTAALVLTVNFVRGNFSSPPPYFLEFMVGQFIGLSIIPMAFGGIGFAIKRRIEGFFVAWLIGFILSGSASIYQARLDASGGRRSESVSQAGKSFV